MKIIDFKDSCKMPKNYTSSDYKEIDEDYANI